MRHIQVVQQCRQSDRMFDPAITLQCFYTAAQLDVSVACTVQITGYQLVNPSKLNKQASRHQGPPASVLQIM